MLEYWLLDLVDCMCHEEEKIAGNTRDRGEKQGGGVAVGLGKSISYKGTFSISYYWTNCGGDRSRLSVALDVEQCYWGVCWAANIFTYPDEPKDPKILYENAY